MLELLSEPSKSSRSQSVAGFLPQWELRKEEKAMALGHGTLQDNHFSRSLVDIMPPGARGERS